MRRDSPLSRLRATRPLISRLLVVVLLATLSACSGDDNGANDSGASDSAIDGAARDAAPADSSLADGALPSTCAGACAEQALEAIFSTTTEGFERAIYGIDTTGAQPTLYLEALSGGFSGCPKQDSPTPDRSLLITGLRLPSSGTLSEADGVTITLLDYRGTLLPAKPLSKATKITITYTAADVCPSCVGKPAPADPNGFIALDVNALFPQGQVYGHVYALHCDSLDL